MVKGKVVKREERVVEVLDRLVLVEVWEYSTGMQRVNSKFVDKNKHQVRERHKMLKRKLNSLAKIIKDGEQVANKQTK